MQLAGAVVVVTGASSGIGAATAGLLLARGARVVAVGRDESALSRLGPADRLAACAVDVRNVGHAEQVVAAGLDRWGRIDGVIANAGVGHAGDFASTPPERIEELVDVNVRAPMLLTRAALPALVDSRGGLVFVSSIAGAVPVSGEAAYSFSKHALEAFADSLRPELRGSGVRVTTVRPGVVATAFFDRRGAAYDRRLPRPVGAERVAEAVVDALQSGRMRVTVPRWLGIPAALRRRAPVVYRALSRLDR